MFVDMQKSILLLLFFSLTALGLFAQNASCDGQRYKSEVFTQVKSTTIQYASVINQAGIPQTLSMDIYEPVGDTASARPVIVLAHGGAFLFGERAQMAPTCELFARRGYVVATISYRLYPIVFLGFPDSIKMMNAAFRAMGDMKAAVRHFRLDRAGNNVFRADTAHIFVGGVSAGAIMAVHAGYMDDGDNIPTHLRNILDANGGINGNSGSAANRSYSSRVSAVINLSGGIYRAGWIEPGDIPLISYHGTDDDVVYYNSGLAAGYVYLEGSGLMHPRAREVNLREQLITVPGGGHSNIYDAPEYAQLLDSTLRSAALLMEDLTCNQITSVVPVGADAHPDWSVWPNPATDRLFLQLPSPAAEIRAFDVQGRLLKSWFHQPADAILQLDGLPGGLIFVQWMDEQGAIFPARRVLIGGDGR